MAYLLEHAHGPHGRHDESCVAYKPVLYRTHYSTRTPAPICWRSEETVSETEAGAKPNSQNIAAVADRCEPERAAYIPESTGATEARSLGPLNNELN